MKPSYMAAAVAGLVLAGIFNTACAGQRVRYSACTKDNKRAYLYSSTVITTQGDHLMLSPGAESAVDKAFRQTAAQYNAGDLKGDNARQDFQTALSSILPDQKAAQEIIAMDLFTGPEIGKSACRP